MIKNLIVAIVTLVFITGCAVKQTDTTSEKTAKHLVNAPFYVVFGAAKLATVAGGAVGYGVSKMGDAVTGRELYMGEEYLGDTNETTLDNNASYAKYYSDPDFAMYKNEKNENLLLLKESGELIKSSKALIKKRWAAAAIEGKRHLHVFDVRLPDDMDEKYILGKLKKDRFGNPVFFGDNVVLELKQSRSGWALTLHSKLFIIPGGANTVGMADKNAPDTIEEQVKYYFSKTS